MNDIAEIEMRDTLPDPSEYFALFETTGWNQEYALKAEELQRAIRDSWCLITAYDDGKLIGTGRVISDGALHAFIVDVIIKPEYQKRGIGSLIMQRLLEQCRGARLRDVQLFCARGKASFYQRLGFVNRSEYAPGMDFKGGVDGLGGR